MNGGYILKHKRIFTVTSKKCKQKIKQIYIQRKKKQEIKNGEKEKQTNMVQVK